MPTSWPTFFITPVVCGVIGYMTNWIAIKMLFRPHTEKKIFGVRLPFTPGLIPKERVRLIKRLGETISDHLITPDVLEESLFSREVADGVRTQIVHGLEWLKQNEPSAGELLDMLLGSENGDARNKPLGELVRPEWIDAVKNGTSQAAPALLGYALNQLTDNPELDQRLKAYVHKLIDENVNGFARFFVNRDRVYENVKNSALEFLADDASAGVVAEKIYAWLDNALEKNAGVLVDQLLPKLPDVGFFISALEQQNDKPLSPRLTGLFKKAAGSILQYVSVGAMVEKQAERFDVAEGERIILSVVRRELRLITSMGGVLGFILGFLSVLLQNIGLFWF